MANRTPVIAILSTFKYFNIFVCALSFSGFLLGCSDHTNGKNSIRLIK